MNNSPMDGLFIHCTITNILFMREVVDVPPTLDNTTTR